MTKSEKQRQANYSTNDTISDTGVVRETPQLEEGDFQSAFGESLAKALDLNTWGPGEDLISLYSRLEQEISDATKQEDRLRDRIRNEIYPRLKTRPDAPKQAGIYQASLHDIQRVHKGLLFNGTVEACDGTCVAHDTLPITIVQIGVCLVSYSGDQGAWVQRLFRRDLRVGGLDPIEETLEILERRRKRADVDVTTKRDSLSELARRGIMSYAERAVLLEKSTAPWRLGHGHPAPYELMTGSGMAELLDKSIELLSRLILDHKKFLFVPSTSKRWLLTLGNALRPLEYAIIDSAESDLRRLIDQGHYTGEWKTVLPKVKQFVSDAGSKTIVGAYRASAIAPPQLFYAHEDHVHEAALIAIADSALQEHRGFPMLIDLADTVCRATFGSESLMAPIQQAYTDAGEPFSYQSERSTRR